MIRIVGVQRDESEGREFVLLQNQGSMRTNLRGHAVVADCALDAGDVTGVHLFADDVDVPPGQYVVLRTCPGEGHWADTGEGARVFHAYMGRHRAVWIDRPGPIRLLAPQHSYCERSVEPILV